MKHDPVEQQDRSADYADERGVGASAGVYLLEGRFHVAGERTRTEHRLVDMGALRVATLVFEPLEARRAVAGGSTRPYAFSAPPVPRLAPLLPQLVASRLAARPSTN